MADGASIAYSVPVGVCFRVIARLDIKGPNLIKGIQFEGLRVIGDPAEYAKKYAEDADELLYIDTVASLYGRNQIGEILARTSADCFIPITVGGGIRSDGDIRAVLTAGADKVAINSAAALRPDLIREVSERYGSQCIVVSIECKRVTGGWEAYTDCGRNTSGRDAVQWAKDAVALGAGELLITSIDRDGMRRGPDIELLRSINVDVPVIYSGGIRLQDVVEVSKYCDGIAIGAALHYNDCTIGQIKEVLRSHREIR